MSGIILEGSPDNSDLPKSSLGIIFYNTIKQWDPKRIAIIDTTNKKITYGEILQVSVKIAKNLQRLGVKKGDIVTIISKNHWKYLATILACFYIGAIANPLNFEYTTTELKHFFPITKPRVVFCTKVNLKNIIPLKEESYFPEILISYDEAESSAITFDEFLQDDDYNNFTPIEVNVKEDVAMILTSSGTTGLPKCVQLTHFNIRLTMIYAKDPNILDINDKDSLIGFLPFFHIFGNASSLASILSGAKLAILDKFHPERFLQIIDEHKVTKLFVVPPIILFLIKSPLVQKYNISSINDIICGAALVAKEVEEVVEKNLKTTVRQLYGMTETAGAVTAVSHNYKKTGSVGRVIITNHIKVCDPETGKILPPNNVGELRIKGDGIMKGYLGNVEETQTAFDQDGFLKSGDLGYYDEEGNFFIVERLKEIIKYKGFQVSPAELENLLIQHPGIKDVGVIGKPDERAGEVPIAFVVKQTDTDLTEEEIIKFVAENMSSQKHLYGGVRFIEEIPKNPSGKILRLKLKNFL